MTSEGEERNMGDLLGYFETQSEILDSQSNLPLDISPPGFVSLIKFNGVPILPPVLTQHRKEEMRSYKRQALRQDSKRRSKRHQDLHQRVQSIVAGVETQYSLKNRHRLPRTSGISKLLERRAAKAANKVTSPKPQQHVVSVTTKLLPGGPTTGGSVTMETTVQAPAAVSGGEPITKPAETAAKTVNKSPKTKSGPSSTSTAKSSSSIFKSMGRLSKTKSFSTQSLNQSTSSHASRLSADMMSSNSSSPERKALSLSPKSGGIVPRPPEGRPTSRRSSALRQSYSFPDLRSIDFSVEAEELKRPSSSRNWSPKGGRPQSTASKPGSVSEKQKKEKETKEQVKKTPLRTKPKEAFVKEPSKVDQNRQLKSVLQNVPKGDTVKGETDSKVDVVRSETDRSVSPMIVNPLEQLEKELADEREHSSESQRDDVDDESEFLDPIQAAAAALLPSSITEEQALATLDSLQSQPEFIASLEQQGESLPKDYNGIPLTSVKQQQIIQMLTRLSKALNIEDTLLSTTSSSNSAEPGREYGSQSTSKSAKNVGTRPSTADMGKGRGSKSESAGQTSSVEHSEYKVDNNKLRVANPGYDISDDSSNTGNDSRLLSVSPSSSAQNSILSSGGNTSASSAQSRSRMSPTASILSSASSVSGSRSRMSPKSLKNTVHFSSFVTEISTNASQSYEDKISVRKMDITPVNSANFEENKAGGSNLPQSARSDSAKNISDSGEGPSREHVSLLSKVALSPDVNTSVGSSPGEVTGRNIPYSGQEVDQNTSDKENEFESRNEDSPDHNFPSLDCNNQFDYNPGNYGSRNIQVLNCYSTNIPVNTGEITQPSLIKASMKSDCSETSTLKGSQDKLLTEKLSMMEELSGTRFNTDSTSLGKYLQGSSLATDTSSTSMPEEVSKSYLQQAKKQQLVVDNSKKTEKESNVKKSSRRVLNTPDEASPILLRPVVYNHAPKVSDGKPNKSQPAPSQMVKVEEDNEEEYAGEAELEIPEPIKTGEVEEEEQEGKAEHIQKYLSQVHEHSLRNEDDFDEAAEEMENIQEKGYMNVLNNIGATLQSFTSSMNSNHLSHDELFQMQALQFDLLQQQLIEQQKAQLEELFVQQRREQFSMQQEIEVYQQKRLSHEDVETVRLTDSYHVPPVSQSQPQVMQAWQYQDQGPPQFSPAEPMMSQNGRGGALPFKQSNGSNPFSYIQSPSLYRNPKDRDNASEISSIPRASPKQLLFSNQSTPVPKMPTFKPVVRSPVKHHYQRPSARVSIPDEVYDEGMDYKFDCVSAAVKGYLTRRLLRTQKVQEILKTINDTRNFAFSFQAETPIKKGHLNHQDRTLLERIVAQLQAALLDIHEIFFNLSVSERMALIAHSREIEQTKMIRESRTSRDITMSSGHPRVSTATLKAIERKKKAQQAEEAVFGSMEFRPRSAPPPTTSSPQTQRSTDIRALRPLQGQVSPILPADTSRISVKEVRSRPKTAPERNRSNITVTGKSKKTSAVNKPTKMATSTQPATSTTVASKSKVSVLKLKKQEKAWR